MRGQATFEGMVAFLAAIIFLGFLVEGMGMFSGMAQEGWEALRDISHAEQCARLVDGLFSTQMSLDVGATFECAIQGDTLIAGEARARPNSGSAYVIRNHGGERWGVRDNEHYG